MKAALQALEGGGDVDTAVIFLAKSLAAGAGEILVLVLAEPADQESPQHRLVPIHRDRQDDVIASVARKLREAAGEAEYLQAMTDAAHTAAISNVEQPVGPRRKAFPWPLSARTAEDLNTATDGLCQWAYANPSEDPAVVGATLALGRHSWSHRQVAVVEPGERPTARQWSLRALSPSTLHGIAFMFPGQGAQRSGMAAAPYHDEPVFRSVVDHCASLLVPELGCDIRDWLTAPATDPNARDPLTDTAFAQPALFVMSYALARLWQHWGVLPDAMIGHSIGEFVAATLAGVFELDDAVRLVARRGQLMQALPPGAMLAVALDEVSLRKWLTVDIDVAAVNGPGACVASGPAESIAALAERLAGAGIGSRRLRTSHAFHSAMTEPALAAFRTAVEGVRRKPPCRPFVSNLHGCWIGAEMATSPDYWASHLRGTVQFAKGLQCLLDIGCRATLEVGPGRQLTTLLPPVSDCPDLLRVTSSDERGQCSSTALAKAVGTFWAHGACVDWSAYWSGRICSLLPGASHLPGHPFDTDGFSQGLAPDRAGAVASIEF